MVELTNICVYCASSDAVDLKYKQLAKDIGAWCAQNQKTVIYGGGRIGLMGALADSALAQDGRVIGVIPEYLKTKEVAHSGLTELHSTKDLQQRQAKMAELSDAFVVLPGGLGTLAELFEIITWKQLQLHNKPVIIVNAFGYWDHLLKTFQTAHECNFLRQGVEKLCDVCETVDQMILLLENSEDIRAF